jgi:hypothetical protein
MDTSDLDRVPDGSFSDYDFVTEGQCLSLKQARAFMRETCDHPHDLRTRLLILGYLNWNLSATTKWADSYLDNLSWMIDHHPEHSVLELLMGFPRDCPHFRKAKNLWLKQVRIHANDTAVLANAASFCVNWSPRTTERLLRRAQQLDPENEEWPLRLSDVYRLHACQDVFGSPKTVGRKAIAAFVNALELHEKYPKQSYLETYVIMCTTNLADMAINCELYEEANMLGLGLLDLKPKEYTREAFDGKPLTLTKYLGAAHAGYVILGMTAIAQKNFDLAAERMQLMKSVPVPQSPDLRLMNELLRRKRSDVVIEYLNYLIGDYRLRIEQLKKEPPEVDPFRQAALRKHRVGGRPTELLLRSWEQELRKEESKLLDLLSKIRMKNSAAE